MLLERIELFVTAARHHNIAKTAREMHVSASSVCQRLKTLELDFNVKLYKRSKYGIELTIAGQTLLTAASDVLTRVEELKNVFKREVDVAPETLRVGGTHSTAARHLPAAVAAFQKTHPDVNVSFFTVQRTRLEKLVQTSEVDVAIIQSPSASSELHLEHFGADNLAFFAHHTHALARKKKLTLTDLSNIPLIIREGTGITQQMLKDLESRGLKISIALSCVSPDAVKAAVRRRMGVGVLFSDLIRDDVKRNDFKILKFSESMPAVETYIVYSKKKPLSGSAAAFLSLLRRQKSAETNGKVLQFMEQAEPKVIN
jgi:LysR family transcriptional regulator, transcriptional activator of the cysJI operon